MDLAFHSGIRSVRPVGASLQRYCGKWIAGERATAWKRCASVEARVWPPYLSALHEFTRQDALHHRRESWKRSRNRVARADRFTIGVTPIDCGPILRLMPFGSHLAVDTLPSGFHERRLQVCLVCFQLSPSCPHRLSPYVSILFGRRGITPAFGYDAPHSSVRGTSTLLNNALLSAPYNLIRLLMSQAAAKAAVHPRTLIFKHTVQLWSEWIARGLCDRISTSIDVLFTLIGQLRVGNRPRTDRATSA
jgi:hypothetical protein